MFKWYYNFRKNILGEWKYIYNIVDLREKLPINRIRLQAGEIIPIRKKAIERVVIHCSDFEDRFGTQDVYRIAEYDVTPSPKNHLSTLGAFTISYHYFIEYFNEELVIYRCLDDNVISWHAKGWNETSLSIAVNKKGTDNNLELWNAAVWISQKLCKELRLNGNQVYFHRELVGTGWVLKDGKKVLLKECPGLIWDPHKFREEVISGL